MKKTEGLFFKLKNFNDLIYKKSFIKQKTCYFSEQKINQKRNKAIEKILRNCLIVELINYSILFNSTFVTGATISGNFSTDTFA
jgi:hypothetical protein